MRIAISFCMNSNERGSDIVESELKKIITLARHWAPHLLYNIVIYLHVFHYGTPCFIPEKSY